ncbi:MAG: diacylglycerol kinase family lipid kinase [Hyphomicrobiales bacterium]|nr:diacylglycerol kinase family lipid kinase [Hyphomicrobiales bacterium]
MRPLAIVNPASGGGRCGRKAPRLLERLAQRGFSPEVVFTKAQGDASAIAARAFITGRRTIVVMGGDGTLFEVVNGLMPHARGDERLLVCVAPLGTGNSLVRDLPSVGGDAIGENSATAAASIDLLRVVCDERTFWCANMVSFGFAAAVGRLVNNRLKPLGSAGYSAGVLWMVARLAPHLLPYRLDAGDFRREALTLLSVANSRYTGAGMLMAPQARVDDAEMDVVSGAEMSRSQLLRLFPKIFDGSHVASPLVLHKRAKTLEFEFSAPIGMIADGEFLEATPRRIEVEPRALRMAAIRPAI